MGGMSLLFSKCRRSRLCSSLFAVKMRLCYVVVVGVVETYPTLYRTRLASLGPSLLFVLARSLAQHSKLPKPQNLLNHQQGKTQILLP
jgi:hypothetical protein